MGAEMTGRVTNWFGRYALVALASVATLVAGCGGGGGGAATAPKVENVSATAVDGGYSVSWNSFEGATKYYVFYAQGGGVSEGSHEGSREIAATSVTALTAGTAVEGTTDTTTSVSTTITGLVNGAIYTFAVRANDDNGPVSSLSDPVTKIAAPTVTSATQVAATGDVTVVWNAIGGAQKYVVAWGTDSTVAVGSVETTAATYVIPALSGESTWYVKVTVFAGDISSESSVATVTVGASCGAAHTWTGKTAMFSYASCDTESGKTVWSNTANDDGETLGTRSAAYGKLSFTITGTTNYEIPSGDAMLIFVHALTNDREVNWHFQYYNLGAEVEHRLTTQRFDGVCSNFCEQKTISRSLQFPNSSTDRSTSYHFDCTWESGDEAFTYASCDVSDPTSGDTIYRTGQVDTQGPYGKLHYVGVGNGGWHGAGNYGWPAGGSVSDFQLTFFE
jgi:hypothetical protein